MDIEDNFFDVGGDSITAANLVIRIREEFGREISPSEFLRCPSVSRLAHLIRDSRKSRRAHGLLPLKDGTSRLPLFFIAPALFDLLTYKDLIQHIETGQAVYGMEGYEELLSSSVEETASRYIDQILSRFTSGPFALIGFSSGGVIAFEMALQLHAMHIEVPFLAMLDSSCPVYLTKKTPWWRPAIIAEFLRNLPLWLYYYGADKKYIKAFVRNRISEKLNLPAIEGEDPGYQFHDLMKKINGWLRNYQPGHYPGRIVYYKARGQGLFRPLIRDKGWRHFADRVDACSIPGTHNQMLL